MIVEDLFTVLVLVLLPVATREQLSGDLRGIALSVGTALLKILASCVFPLLVGQRLIPRLLHD